MKYLIVIMLVVATQCQLQEQPINQDSREDMEDLVNQKEEPVVPPLPTLEHCGFRNVVGLGKTTRGIWGNELPFGIFPWMVAILTKVKGVDIPVYRCGGSLINPSVVLTAAHCVVNLSAAQIKVRAGEWDTQSEKEIFPHQDRYVTRVVYHQEYNKDDKSNDIALLFLKSEFNLADNVQPVCLPSTDFKFDSSSCDAIGWGKDLYGQRGIHQVILKISRLPIIPRDTCQNRLRLTQLGKNFKLHESFICAGGEADKFACHGDEGSPLVCPIPGIERRYYQVGIVAWGLGCRDKNVTGVYANVAKLRPWIDEQLEHKIINHSLVIP